MNITMRNWQPTVSNRPYKSQAKPTDDTENKKPSEIQTDETSRNSSVHTETGSQINPFHPVRNQEQEQKDLLSAMPGQGQAEEGSLLSSLLEQKQEQEGFLNSLLEQTKESSNFKVSVSIPDDSTGQLASELANSETKMNVLHVSSKAMRALANLKMAYALSEGKDQEKIALMIRRMQKLTKQIQKKMKNLTKEELLELRRKRAEERQELEKELEIRKEISRRKKKRRREEHNYAAKEMNEDRKEAMQETIDAMAASMGGVSSAPELAAMAGVSGTAASAAAIAVGTEAYAASAGAPMMESASVDVVM